MTATPGWATAARKATLVEMFSCYGNQCLQGHHVCPNPSHYKRVRTKGVLVTVPDRVEQARNRDGTPREGVFYQTYGLAEGTVVTEVSEERLYEAVSEEAIRHWTAEDRAESQALWKAEQGRMHREHDHRFRQGAFDSLRRERFLATRPDFYVLGMSIDPLTFRRVAYVRIPSTGIGLFVDITGAVQGASKSARRKATRYGKPLPPQTGRKVEEVIGTAIADWWAKRAG